MNLLNNEKKYTSINLNDNLLTTLINKSTKNELKWKSASSTTISLVKNSDEDYSNSDLYGNYYVDYTNFYETTLNNTKFVITREVFNGGMDLDYYSGLYVIQDNIIAKKIYSSSLNDKSLLQTLYRNVDTSQNTNEDLIEKLIEDLNKI